MYFKIIITIATILASSFALRAQSVQSGQVLLYHGSDAKTPLSNVSISAIGAGAVTSDSEGHFELKFRTLHAGDVIQFRRIELSGFEVMNTEALEVARVANVSSEAASQSGLLTIIMCSSEELAQLKDGYRTVASERYQKQLEEKERELAQLKSEGKLKEDEYNKRVEALEEQYEAQLQTLDTYVDKFARIDLSELDEFEQQIIALVQEGRIDEAIAKYDEQNLTKRLQEGVQQQRQLTNDVQKLDTAIHAKAQEAQRLETNINKQVELLKKVGGEANERKAQELQQVLE